MDGRLNGGRGWFTRIIKVNGEVFGDVCQKATNEGAVVVKILSNLIRYTQGGHLGNFFQSRKGFMELCRGGRWRGGFIHLETLRCSWDF